MDSKHWRVHIACPAASWTLMSCQCSHIGPVYLHVGFQLDPDQPALYEQAEPLLHEPGDQILRPVRPPPGPPSPMQHMWWPLLVPWRLLRVVAGARAGTSGLDRANLTMFCPKKPQLVCKNRKFCVFSPNLDLRNFAHCHLGQMTSLPTI